MSIKIKDKIYIDKSQYDIPKQLRYDLTYKNPKYYQNLNMGISVYNVNKKIRTFTESKKTFAAFRGEIRTIGNYFPNAEIELEHKDHPVNIQYVNNEFTFDRYQQAAMQAVENKRQGTIHAVTSAGKSVMALKAIVKRGERGLLVVHRKFLMKQLLADIDKYIRDSEGNKIEAGKIGDGYNKIGDVTVAIYQTLQNNLDKYKDQFGTVIMDECHIAPAKTIRTLMNELNSKYRYGVTGTTKRKDKKQFLMYATFGHIIARITEEDLLKIGRIVPVEFKTIESDVRFNYQQVKEVEGTTKAYRIMIDYLMEHTGRRQLIIDSAAKMKGKTIVMLPRVKVCKQLAQIMEYLYNKDVGVVTGQTKNSDENLQKMKDGELDVIFATVGCVSTGVSIKDLDNVILAAPIYNNPLKLKQIKGRLMRNADGKKKGTLYFIYDHYVFYKRKLEKLKNILEN